MSYWREFVKDPEEVKLFEALEDPQYEWRTLGALQRASGMSEADILRVWRQGAGMDIRGPAATIPRE